MSKQMDFFIELLEQYAEYKDVSADDMLQKWNNHGITQTIYDSYEMYHTERIENAFDDIDSLLNAGKHAW